MAVKITPEKTSQLCDYAVKDFPVGVLGVTTVDPFHAPGRLSLRPHGAPHTLQYLTGVYNSDPACGGTTGVRIRHLTKGEKFIIEGE